MPPKQNKILESVDLRDVRNLILHGYLERSIRVKDTVFLIRSLTDDDAVEITALDQINDRTASLIHTVSKSLRVIFHGTHKVLWSEEDSNLLEVLDKGTIEGLH